MISAFAGRHTSTSISDSRLKAILQLNSKLGNIDLAIQQYCDKNNDDFYQHYILDYRRGLGLKLFGNLRGKRVLDFGCEFGTLGWLAAKLGAEVTFAEADPTALAIAEARCQSYQLFNTSFLVCKNLQDLPIHLPPFDLILLNGVLDNLPHSASLSLPASNQQKAKFLTSFKTYLNSDGYIYLSGNNRNGLSYLRLNRQLRNNIWSLKEYYRYIAKAGLDIREAYGIFPNFQFPQTLVPLSDAKELRGPIFRRKNRLSNKIKAIFPTLMYHLGCIKHFCNSYAFILTPNQHER